MVALFLSEVVKDVALLTPDHMQKLITLVLKIGKKAEDNTLLNCLEPIFAVSPPIVQEFFASLSYTSLLEHMNLNSKDLQWLRQQGLSFPNHGQAEQDLITYHLQAHLGHWWLMHVAQGITTFDQGEGNLPRRKNILEDHKEALREMKDKTWEQLVQDKRFKKHSPTVRVISIDSTRYRIECRRNSSLLHLFTVDGSAIALMRSGCYTFERLLSILEKDAQARSFKEPEAVVTLAALDLRALFLDLEVTVIDLEEEATNDMIESLDTAVCIQKMPDSILIYYFDPAGGIGMVNEIRWSRTCVEEARQFIEAHHRLIRQKIEALQEAEFLNSFLWTGPRSQGEGEYIVVGEKGDKTSISLRYVSNGQGWDFERSFKGIPTPEQVKSKRDVIRHKAAFIGATTGLFGVIPMMPFLDHHFHATMRQLEKSTNFHGLALFEKEPFFLIVTRDLLVPNTPFLMPAMAAELTNKGRALHLVREQLSGWKLNRELIKTFSWQQIKLIHETPVPIDLNQLVSLLDGLKESPYLKHYVAHHANCSFTGMRANLERFLNALQMKDIQGFVPFEKYEKEYRTLEIQLTHTLHQLLEQDQQEDLSQFVCELGYYTQYCGPTIADCAQFFYNTTFKLLSDRREPIQGGIEQLLKKGYGRAALEVLDRFLDFTQDAEATMQTRHVLKYLRNTLTKAGISLPPDSRVETKDKWDLTYGPNDFPEQHVPMWFERMLLPHFVEVLNDMQNEARVAKDFDLGALLLNSIQECVYDFAHAQELVDLTEKIALLTSEKEASLLFQHSHREVLVSRREALHEEFAGDWQSYQALLRHLTEIGGRIDACSDQLLALHNESEGIDMSLSAEANPPKVPSKRKYSQYVAEENGIISPRQVQTARLVFIGDETKKMHGLRENHRRELSVLNTLIANARSGRLKQIFDLEEELSNVDQEVTRIAERAKKKIAEQIEEACESLGWIERDEYCAASVTKKGLTILLKKNGHLSAGPELLREIERLRDYQRQSVEPPVPAEEVRGLEDIAFDPSHDVDWIESALQ